MSLSQDHINKNLILSFVYGFAAIFLLRASKLQSSSMNILPHITVLIIYLWCMQCYSYQFQACVTISGQCGAHVNVRQRNNVQKKE